MTAPGFPKNDWQAKATGVSEDDYRYKNSDQNLVADNIIWTRGELDTKYESPPTGIPESDLSAPVQTKLNTIGGSGGNVAADTHAAPLKTTPADADEVPLADSAASFGLKRFTWANLKAVIKSYYDSVTSTLTNKTISGASNTLSNIAVGSLSATGTPSSTTYLSGAGAWSTPAGGSGGGTALTDDGTGLFIIGTGTMGGYTPGGTEVPLGDGGTGASLVDPNEDRLMFWDDSAGAVSWLTLGSNLSILGTTINAPGSGGIVDVVEDTSPQLGGDLDPNGHKILSNINTLASSATPTINTNTTDIFGLTAQAADITSFTTNLSGSPTNGQLLSIYVVGTATRQIAWGSSFEHGTALLPTATNGTERLDVLFIWNAGSSKWRCMECSFNATIVSSSTSLTLSTDTRQYVFTGTSAGGWTLPSVAASVGVRFTIFNRGTANLTLTRTAPDNVWTTAAVFNVVVPLGSTAVLFNDGTYWVVQSPNQSLYEPRIVGVREMATGNKVAEFWSEASAVNYLITQSKAAGSGPNIQVAGTDTDIHFNLFPKGTGFVRINVASGQTPTLSGNISGGGNGNLALVSPGSGGYITVNGARAGTRSPLVNTVGSAAAPAINVDTTDLFTITALGTAITSMSTGISGTPINGQPLTVRIKDNSSAQTIAWGASWRAVGVTLPTTTVSGKTMYITARYNSTDSVWDALDVKQQA